MLLFAAATASEVALRPKNIAISLSARWPATPLAAEAAEFMADEGQFYKFVEGFAAIPTTATTDRAQLEKIEAVATNLLSPLGVRTLRAFLAAHVHSPRVEMWRQLSAAEEEERAKRQKRAERYLSFCMEVTGHWRSPGQWNKCLLRLGNLHVLLY